MIKFRLKEIMDAQHIGIREAAREAGLAINTISGIYHSTTKRVDTDTLDKLCDYFGVGVGDIMEHVKEPPQE
ncbi:helix-turn-helix transcriptional regulator [Paenibacillus sp. FSL K6-1096]|uniref:helix-turn-helix domain-containing protein n=1 Tax=Paenibacillus sp. FSL K6-1096 TaxID=2921460 RepID=UPI0030EC5D85